MEESLSQSLAKTTSVRTTLWRMLRLAVPAALVLGAPFALYRLILDHMVNIPFLDDWMFVRMFQREHDHTLTLHDFFVVQMEHRMAFVRAIIFLFHKIWPTDYTKQLWVSWLLLTLTYLNVGVLLHKTTGRSFRNWGPLLVLCSTIIFSPVQYRIVLWPMMFQVACPGFFLSLALVALLSPWPLWLRWIVGVLCASCATQTFATGILVWLLPLPLVCWGGAIRGRRSQILFAATWLFVFAVTMALYFTNLKNEVDPDFSYKAAEGDDSLHHDTGYFFKHLDLAIPYVLRFLGGHLGRGSDFTVMAESLGLGTFSLVLFLGALGYWSFHFKRADLRARLLPWLLFGSYSIGAGVLVAMGRLWASTDNSLAPRYVIHAVPLTVSLVALGWLISHDWMNRHPRRNRVPLRITQGMAIMFLLCLQTVSWAHGCRLMEIWESSRLRGATNTLFYKVRPEVQDITPGTRNLAKIADDLGLLNPPMLKDRALLQFTTASEMLDENTAEWTDLKVEKNEHGVFGQFRGYACLPRRIRAADGIFFTLKNPAKDNRWEIFYVTQVSAMPLYLMDTLARDMQFIHFGGELQKEGVAGFAGTFNFDLLKEYGPGPHRLAAWAFDYKSHKVYLMGGYFEIDIDKQTIIPQGTDPAAVKLGDFAKHKTGKKKKGKKAREEPKAMKEENAAQP